MPLTPSDVSNKQFKVAFRGYSLDEVDAFLDEVESEIGRLLRENDQLRTSGSTTTAPVTLAKPEVEPVAAPVERPLAAMEGQEAALRTLLLAQRTADEAVAEARAEAAQIVEAARAEAQGTVGSARAEADTALTDARAEAERLVSQAQEFAERTVREAREEAESTLTSARAEAESTLTSARTEAESTLTSARTEAESTVTSARAEAEGAVGSATAEAEATLSSARAEAETTLARSRETAARADAEVAAKVAASLGDLEERRTGLEQRIEDLQSFEREYRTRLKAFLRTQLADLDDGHGPDDDGRTGVPHDAPERAATGALPQVDADAGVPADAG